MACTNHTFELYAGEEFNEFFGWVDDDGNHLDMTGDTGDLILTQEGVEVDRYELTVNYVDADTKQINAVISAAESAALTVGEYGMILKIMHGNPVYLPQDGGLFLNLKTAL